MGKSLFIAEKPSVAQEFARVLGASLSRKDGWLEGPDAVFTWCVGHLVSMSYPEAYDPALKKWRMDTLPFLPENFRYEVIAKVKKQFDTVASLLHRQDIDTVYVCTDSGREGEYIYRLVEQMAGVQGKERKRVWIDSQTEEEIRRGVREAKDLSAYDNLSDAAYLRAKEDYLMGINFSRLLTLKYGNAIARRLNERYTVVAVGRVMTCVLGMVVRREQEIRAFVKTPFYKVQAMIGAEGGTPLFPARWKAVEGSRFFGTPDLYDSSGLRTREAAERLIASLGEPPCPALIKKAEKKTEKKAPPLLYNLAELQNEASRMLKLSPDRTLAVVQELYEKKLTTYPRTDARVLSSAVAKQIDRNLQGLKGYAPAAGPAEHILSAGLHRKIASSRYTDDRKITDHYAIIPTGQGLSALGRLDKTQAAVYGMIVRRFLSIFYPPAVYEKRTLELDISGECFTASFRILKSPGYLAVAGLPRTAKQEGGSPAAGEGEGKAGDEKAGAEKEKDEEETLSADDPRLQEFLASLKAGQTLTAFSFAIKEGETKPPRRYTSGSLILAMENAGQFIEDEELRAQIKGSGIGTSATRAEILKKLVSIRYLSLAAKTQVITPTQLGEYIFHAVSASIPSLLNPELTASWEKGLTMVAEGTLGEKEYMEKLTGFIARRVEAVRNA